MSSAQKYRVRDVAKDFEVTAKVITEILEKYATAPKSNMQSLTDEELNIIFDVLTLRNQVESFESLMAEVYSGKKEEEAPAEKEEAKVEKKANEKKPAGEKKSADKPKNGEKKKAEPKEEPKEEMKPKKGVQTYVIDTRGGSVDLSKYDDRVDNLVPDKVRDIGVQKQKIKKSPDRKQQNYGNKRRQEEQEKMKKLEQQVQKKPQVTVMIPDEISVGELASRMKRTGADVVKQLIKLGVMASVSDVIDYDTAAIVALEMGAKVEKEVIVTIEDKLIDESEDKAEDLKLRDPVVVVMGHVDHGKTSLLDAVRKTNVVSGEAGGITQHIGAYRVDINGRKITFLDTPGHEAFTSMRARGAQITDVAILVVAADDGIMPQTVEAINHAKAADVPIVVAINKMDAEGANPDRIKQQLTEYELVAEEWGGSTIVCPISAKLGQGIDDLLEMVILTADMLELKANPDRAAKGTVVEAKLDRGRGPVATLLVSNGTLNAGDVVIAGTSVGRIRAMTDDKGRKIKTAGPSVPVEIIGLSEVPNAGDIFYAVEDERMARELVEQRKQTEKDELNKSQSRKVSLEDLFDQIQQGEIKELPIIVKADVKGSAEAVKASLEKLSNDEVRVRVIHAGVGGINESDILLASASNAIVVGFNVRPDAGARDSAAASGTDIRTYRIIYDCIEEIEAAMKGLLAPTFREEVLGHAEIRQTFKVSKVGTIAGCRVTDGKITRNASVRVVRDGIVVYDGLLASLKRFKDDAKEVDSGYECGLSIENFNDIKEGDVVEAYAMVEVKE
ncbi:MAG: translation initiation factor IF-2 [Ruminococcaceae bacterium]|nr:translation initiation factor IF-2 [Oscillospiraceae bacterium]MBQ7120119.1 translation initiation factor IF-2 [Oscillospiraceae bacterium]